MINQELMRIQHEQGYLSEAALNELSERINVPLHRLHEVASFFPHFRLEPSKATVHVAVCRDMTCHLRGSPACRQTLDDFAKAIPNQKVHVEGVSCLGRCDQPVAVSINEKVFVGESVGRLQTIIQRMLAGEAIEPPASNRSSRGWKIDPYDGQRPYEMVRKFVRMHIEYQGWFESRKTQFAAPAAATGPLDDALLADIARVEGCPEAAIAHYVRRSKEERKREREFLRTRPWLIPAEWVLYELGVSDLRGMGGAAFPAGEKWKSVRRSKTKDRGQSMPSDYIPDNPQAHPGAPPPIKYVVCNGDESEPGTFKDRELLLCYPHLVLEGMILAGLTTGARQGYIYIRHEYTEQIAVVRQAIEEARTICAELFAREAAENLTFKLADVYVSPGGYICGEQNALLAAMHDFRAEPRNKPPSVSDEGLYGQPTVLNNVETFGWVPAILNRGGQWYAEQGVNRGKGLRLFSISGDLQRPGVYEVPVGITLGELLKLAGGMADGKELGSVALSGPSGGFTPRFVKLKSTLPRLSKQLVELGICRGDPDHFDLLDLPLEFDLLKRQIMLGAAIVFYGDQANILEQSLNCIEFFANETCGKCVPCRVGTQKLRHLVGEAVKGRPLDQQLIADLNVAMVEGSICGLGQVAPGSIISILNHYPTSLPQSPQAD